VLTGSLRADINRCNRVVCVTNKGPEDEPASSKHVAQQCEMVCVNL
jgi:hypothetical protein